ncbi:peptidoglycan-binding domain-containing protein [Arenibacterium halophilum]|uniref:Peptidoglycan-binding protein n=1 Tax=Arenibacterium halophilum TaxID=2583821 RepID=A0ABY2X9M2_9RHOB|nr:peptidoglycan-binding domain-containing protein [Arenibacterium halophilum]TMV12743.1 peptidoglycan-binding protein [Arenibacterium halophilum]
MLKRNLCASLMAASVIVFPVERAQADRGAALLGGALLGGIIVNEINKNKRRRTVSSGSSAAYSAQRAQNRQVQTALNYFGYNAGTVDGSLGSRSRAAISQYQAQMGFNPDGGLDDYERDFLLGSHQRAMASSHVAPYNQIVAQQGPAGLLRTYRNEQLGISTTTAVQPAPAPAPAPAPVPVATAPAPQPMPAPTPAPAATPAPTEPVSVTTRSDNASLPSFTFGQADRSVSQHCSEINVLTAANGGITAPGRVTDSEFALNEQFCLARTHAMAESNSITATIPNLTEAQIEQQCQGLAQVIKPQLSALPTARPDMVISDASAVLQGSGQPMAQLISGGKVCLGVGYRTDNAEMALASAVLLSAAGQLGYGEAVSHHMREGFGTAQADAAKSGAWMSLALNAVTSTAGAAVMGQSQDRVAVLQDASQGSASGGASAGLPVFPAPSGN